MRSLPTSYCLAWNDKQVSLPTSLSTRTLLVCRATSKPTCICVAPHSKHYVGAYTFCCYLKHQYQVSVWNTTSDLVGKTDPMHYGWINISLLCVDSGARSLRQELSQGKVLSQISWSCSISMNLSLHFAKENEVASNASVISAFFFFFSSAGNEVFLSVA